jgi:molybdopterin-guanine dinucleotide biosynthesis protein A
MSVSAVVLAGGRSSRFGRDKLAEPIDGRTLLAHAVEAVAAVAEEIVVVLSPDAHEPPLPVAVRFAHDTEPYRGPLVGLLAGLEATTGNRVVVVAGDMPTLEPAVLGLLLDRIGPARASALEDGGVTRPLPMTVERRAALTICRGLVADGRRDLRSLLDGLAVSTVHETEWRSDDPGARTLRDIDRPSDLA